MCGIASADGHLPASSRTCWGLSKPLPGFMEEDSTCRCSKLWLAKFMPGKDGCDAVVLTGPVAAGHLAV